MATKQRLQPLQNGQSGSKNKLAKTYQKRLYKHIRHILCKKRLENTLNMWKMRRFWKLEKWPLCKGYSLCKMGTLGQKINMPKTSLRVNYRRPMQKTAPKKLNPLTAEWALRALIDFTLSNARRFYSSMGNPLDGKGLICEKWDDFENWKNGRYAKAIAFAN